MEKSENKHEQKSTEDLLPMNLNYVSTKQI